MDEKSRSTDRIRAILVLLATVGTIIFNGLAATGYVNGVTPEVISAKYPTVVTPAGYAFTIWSLIYAAMIAFSIYQALPSNLAKLRPVRTLYILSCLLNCGWIYFWHREAIAICLVLIFGLLVTLILMIRILRKPKTTREALFTTAPLGLYAGWVTAATLVNLAILLVSSGSSLSSQAWNILGSALIVVAALAAVIVRWKLRNFLYPLAVAWAMTAIGVKQSGNTPIVVAAAFATIICLVMSISFVMDLKSSANE
ncbi:MAG: tryptophan-rich sensory protein [Pyrinomonadaceae bacterium]|nr:tryptophan-rich sensory protein [Pyrinomonadaceae bacterium]MBP6214354.1 tryptophan-rich sensory protein [Pyrinomonadaceae bacterium]